MILTISFSAILYYYALLCLTLMPVSIIMMIILARRTNLMERVNTVVDKILPPQPEDAPASTKEEIAEAQQVVENVRVLSGVSVFKIRVGEKYQCHLNFQNRGGSYGEMVWFNDNEFVGKVSSNGLFKSSKAGLSNIYCVSKGHAYEAGVQAYAIEVVPSDAEWFVDKLISQVSKRLPKQDVLVANIARKIFDERPEQSIIHYAGLPVEGTFSMAVQFDELNTLVRGCYTIQKTRENLNAITANLNDRFEQVKIKGAPEMTVWIHQIIDNDHQEVDIYAILRTCEDYLLLCVGQSWREYGEKEEFLDNIQMAGRQFEPITGIAFPNEIEAVLETPEDESRISSQKPVDDSDIAPDYPTEETEPEPESSAEPYSHDSPQNENEIPEDNNGQEENKDRAQDNDQEADYNSDELNQFENYSEGIEEEY